MTDDIFESVSQRVDGEETAENSRIREVAYELHRRCQLYEAQFRDGEKHVSHFEIEQRVAELYARENGMWLPMSDVFDLGVPGPSGNENDTYVSNDIIYKVNNLLNSGSILKLFAKIYMHNNLFYDTCYNLYAFTGFEGRTVMPVFKQSLVKNARPATPIEIETSVMMHYHPELVRLEEAGEGRSRQFAIPALREGKVWMPRHWTLVTEDTGIGNPALSTAEKGRRFADACADGFALFLRDFARITNQTDLYK